MTAYLITQISIGVVAIILNLISAMLNRDKAPMNALTIVAILPMFIWGLWLLAKGGA